MEKAFGDSINRSYGQAPHTEHLINANRSIATNFGIDNIVPNMEFAGGLGGIGGLMGYGGPGFGILGGYGDIGSNPFRYSLGYGGLGLLGSEGWAYRRASINIDHFRIAQCLLMYRTEGYIQTFVHLLADFAADGLNLDHENNTVQNFYRAWAVKVDLRNRFRRFIIDLITTGNIFVWRKEAKLKQRDQVLLKRGVAVRKVGENLVVTLGGKNKLRDEVIDIEVSNSIFPELAEFARQVANDGKVDEIATQAKAAEVTEVSSEKIPWGYTSLNPLQMEIRGSRFAGEQYWVMKLHRDDVKPLAKLLNYTYYTDLGKTKVELPPELRGRLKRMDKADGDYLAEITLDPERISVIQDITKKDYEDWATPSIYPAVKEVGFKRMLRSGEASAMESLKHMITLIKLGKVESDLIPSQEQIDRVATALAGGSQGHYLVWDDLISGEVLQPNVTAIFDPKKYESIDKDISLALGMPTMIMTGQGSYSNSFLAIKLLLQKLETIRDLLVAWLFKELRIIADKMKFKKMPSISFDMMNLRDENAERNLIINLFDRGILSRETALEYFDTNFDLERSRQVNERNEVGNDLTIMTPRGPFLKEPVSDVARMDEAGLEGKKPSQFHKDNLELQKKMSPKPIGGPGGRPKFSGKPQQVKRKTKPRGMSNILEYEKLKAFAMSAYDKVQEILNQKTVASKGVKDIRSVDKDTKVGLEKLTNAVVSLIKPTDIINVDLVYKIAGGICDSDSEYYTAGEISESIRSICAENISNAETKEAKREILCTAYAMSLAFKTDEEV